MVILIQTRVHSAAENDWEDVCQTLGERYYLIHPMKKSAYRDRPLQIMYE